MDSPSQAGRELEGGSVVVDVLLADHGGSRVCRPSRASGWQWGGSKAAFMGGCEWRVGGCWLSGGRAVLRATFPLNLTFCT